MRRKVGTPRRFLIPAPFVLFTLLFGIACLLAGVRLVANGKETYSWPSVPGEIIGFIPVERPENDNPDTKGLVATRYVPFWEYEYTVEGELFTSRQIRRGEGPAFLESAAREASARFPVGTAVTVFYNPENASSALLVRGAPPIAVIAAFGGGMFAIGLGSFLVFLQRKEARNRNAARDSRD